jgi:hypothetical protein
MNVVDLYQTIASLIFFYLSSERLLGACVGWEAKKFPAADGVVCIYISVFLKKMATNPITDTFSGREVKFLLLFQQRLDYRCGFKMPNLSLCSNLQYFFHLYHTKTSILLDISTKAWLSWNFYESRFFVGIYGFVTIFWGVSEITLIVKPKILRFSIFVDIIDKITFLKFYFHWKNLPIFYQFLPIFVNFEVKFYKNFKKIASRNWK